jgi:hypothetical protein
MHGRRKNAFLATGSRSGVRSDDHDRRILPGRSGTVIVMDRKNLWAPGWSHVLSTTNDVAELREFCGRVGAPPAALHLGNRGRWPHLDLKLLPRERALACSDVRVFERTSDMLRFLKSLHQTTVALDSAAIERGFQRARYGDP